MIFSNIKGVSVEAVDSVFQTKMLDMLKQTGRYKRNPFFTISTKVSESINGKFLNNNLLLKRNFVYLFE